MDKIGIWPTAECTEFFSHGKNTPVYVLLYRKKTGQSGLNEMISVKPQSHREIVHVNAKLSY